MTKTICSVTRSTDGAAVHWLSPSAAEPQSDGGGEVNAAEIRMAKLIPLLSLTILLTAAALAWSLESPSTEVTAQMMKDKTIEFSGAQTSMRDAAGQREIESENRR